VEASSTLMALPMDKPQAREMTTFTLRTHDTIIGGRGMATF